MMRGFVDSIREDREVPTNAYGRTANAGGCRLRPRSGPEPAAGLTYPLPMADPNAFTQLREAIPAIRHYHCLNSGGVAPTPQATLDLQQSFYDREAVMTTTSPDLRDVYNTELGALRAEIAALLGAEPDEIALIRAVSEGRLVRRRRARVATR